MTPAEFRAALTDLGMTQVGFARLASVDPSTVRRWLAGKRRIPGTITALIGLIRAELQRSEAPQNFPRRKRSAAPSR